MTIVALLASISVSLAEPRYFADDHGKAWIPVGCNICFDRNANPSSDARRLYDAWMTKFAENGGNFMRVWLSVPFVDVMPTRAQEFSDEATDPDQVHLRELQARRRVRCRSGARYRLVPEAGLSGADHARDVHLGRVF